jgi:undecaprenyl-diphosphatase
MTGASVLTLINRNDHALMHRIHRWSAPDWVRLVMICFTKAGDGWLWLGLGVAILLFGDDSRLAAVLAGGASCGIGLTIYTLIKKTTRRRRPCLIEPHQWARLTPPDQYSFPSGHAIAASSIAISIGHYYPLAEPTLICCAVMIAASRVMLGMHFLSDVIVGSLLGAILGQMVVRIV